MLGGGRTVTMFHPGCDYLQTLDARVDKTDWLMYLNTESLSYTNETRI